VKTTKLMLHFTDEELELIKMCLTDTSAKNQKYLDDKDRDKSYDLAFKEENDMIKKLYYKLLK